MNIEGSEKLRKSKLREIRKAKNVTQKDLAELLTIDKTTYCKKENGVIEFRIQEVIKMKKFFELSNDEVIKIFFEQNVEANSTIA